MIDNEQSSIIKSHIETIEMFEFAHTDDVAKYYWTELGTRQKSCWNEVLCCTSFLAFTSTC